MDRVLLNQIWKNLTKDFWIWLDVFFFQSSLNLVYTSVPNVDLLAMCLPQFKPDPPLDQAQILSEQLFETLILYVFLAPYHKWSLTYL